MGAELQVLVGERIRAIRKEKGLTQEQLAEKSGVYITYISDIERSERNITLDTLEKVLTALDVNPVEVFRVDGIEDIELRTDKNLLIEALNSLLAERKVEEIQMVLRLAKDILNTYDKLN